MNWINVVSIAAVLVLAIAIVKVYGDFYPTKHKFNVVRFMARIAVFGAMSTILYVVPIFTIKLPFFPSFLTLHFDEIPAFIAAFAYGPLAGISVIGIKTILKFVTVWTSTAGVGELGDFILSVLYIVPASIIYKRKRNLKGVGIAFLIGTILQLSAAVLLNVFMYVPLYINLFFGGNDAALLGVMKAAIPAINDWWSYGFLAVLPFNLLKDALVMILTFMIYRSIHKLIRFEK